jgi:hypothetical protein
MLAAAHAPQVKSFVKTCGVRKKTRFFSQATARSVGDMEPNKKNRGRLVKIPIQIKFNFVRHYKVTPPLFR